MQNLKEKILSFFKKDTSKISEYNYNNFFDSLNPLKYTFKDFKTQNFLSYFFTILIMFVLYSSLSSFTNNYLIQSNGGIHDTYSLNNSNSIFLIFLQFIFSILFSSILFLIPNSVYFFDNKFSISDKIKKITNILSFLPHIFFSFIVLLFMLYFFIKIFDVNLSISELQAIQNQELKAQDNKNAFYALSLMTLSMPFIIYFMHLSYLNNKYLGISFFKSYYLVIKALFNNILYTLSNIFLMSLFFGLYLFLSVYFIENENIRFVLNIFSFSFYGIYLKNFHNSLFKLNIEIEEEERISNIKKKQKK